MDKKEKENIELKKRVAPKTLPPPETVEIDSPQTYCDGGPTHALGHPRVYLTVNKHTQHVDCPYCDKRFILKK